MFAVQANVTGRSLRERLGWSRVTNEALSPIRARGQLSVREAGLSVTVGGAIEAAPLGRSERLILTLTVRYADPMMIRRHTLRHSNGRSPTLPPCRWSHGTRLWLGLAGYIIAVDAHAALTGRETMSSAWWRAVQHPHRRWPVVAAWLYITAHLHHLIPARFDPLRNLR